MPKEIYPFVWHLALFVLDASGAAGALASAILLSSPTKTPRYYDVDEMLPKITYKKTSNNFFKEVKKS